MDPNQTSPTDPNSSLGTAPPTSDPTLTGGIPAPSNDLPQNNLWPSSAPQAPATTPAPIAPSPVEATPQPTGPDISTTPGAFSAPSANSAPSINSVPTIPIPAPTPVAIEPTSPEPAALSWNPQPQTNNGLPSSGLSSNGLPSWPNPSTPEPAPTGSITTPTPTMPAEPAPTTPTDPTSLNPVASSPELTLNSAPPPPPDNPVTLGVTGEPIGAPAAPQSPPSWAAGETTLSTPASTPGFDNPAPAPSFPDANSVAEPSSPRPELSEPAPTDLSQLSNLNNDTVYAPPVSNPETLVVPPVNPLPETTASVEGHKKFPKLLLIGGIVVLLLVIAASAYFILGVGKSPEPQPSSIPAQQTQLPLTNPPKPITAPSTQPAPAAASSSATFGNLGGASPSASPSGQSALDLLRAKATASPSPAAR